jgi:hypothetical protein
MKFKPGQSGNPGGRPKVVAEVQDLARQHAPAAIVELARLALKAKNETVRVAAIRELLDRGYGKPRRPGNHAATDDRPHEDAASRNCSLDERGAELAARGGPFQYRSIDVVRLAPPLYGP